jgi:hypothetical protein
VHVLVVVVEVAPGSAEASVHEEEVGVVELVPVSVVSVVVSVVVSEVEVGDSAPSEPELSVEPPVVTTGVVSAARR